MSEKEKVLCPICKMLVDEVYKLEEYPEWAYASANLLDHLTNFHRLPPSLASAFAMVAVLRELRKTMLNKTIELLKKEIKNEGL
jgi:DNA-directed RNA polymerase subunit F